MAGRFSNAFPTFGAKGVDPAKWREHFVPYDGAAWDAEGDGLLQFEAESGHRYSLLIIHDVPLGFLLLFTASESRPFSDFMHKCTVGARAELGVPIDVRSMTLPKGSFIDSARAWLAVEDFLSTPQEPSPRVEWIDVAAIPPQAYGVAD